MLRDAEPVPGRDHQIFDTEIRGLAACIYRGGGRDFTLDYRHAGRQRRMTFARWPEWSVSAARKRAKELRRADHANVGLILDSFHKLARGIDPDTIRNVFGDRIFFVQLADAPRIDWTCSAGCAISATCRAGATVIRAARLGADPFNQPTGPG